jgi:hypothetical protein
MDCHFSPPELPSEETLTESALRFAEEDEDEDDDDDRFVTRLAFKTVDCIANILWIYINRYWQIEKKRQAFKKFSKRVHVYTLRF